MHTPFSYYWTSVIYPRRDRLKVFTYTFSQTNIYLRYMRTTNTQIRLNFSTQLMVVFIVRVDVVKYISGKQLIIDIVRMRLRISRC